MLASPLSAAEEQHFATAPAASLLDHETVRGALEGEQGGLAYQIAKRANVVRVQAAAPIFGKKGCRINSTSLGLIHTAMGKQELNSQAGQFIQQLAESAPLGRYGTAADVVNVAAWLLNQESSFSTGADLLVDGGVHGCPAVGRGGE